MKHIGVLVLSLILASCSTKSKSTDNCGDGIADLGEECDKLDLAGRTCESEGYHSGGSLSCNDDCTLDLSSCATAGSCGDGTINSAEECDGDLLDGESCTSLGHYPGTLSCSDSCTFDFSGCSGRCGDGIINGSEQCDGAELGEITSCSDISPQYHSGTPTCDASCLIDEANCGMCGDGTINGTEECDGGVWGTSCNDEDPLYHAGEGELLCSDSCGLDFSGCHFCGDGLLNGNETCDGTELGANPTCGQMGYAGGTPSCDSSCGSLNYNSCTQWETVEASETHTCALDSDGNVFCWGNVQYGKTGIASTINLLSPNHVALPGPAVSLSAGRYHTCAVIDSGSAFCWGRNDHGQLGVGDLVQRDTPTQVSGASDYVQISAGGTHTCAATLAQGVRCWGEGQDGQTGLCDRADTTSPSNVYSLCPNPMVVNGAHPMYIQSVKAGETHSCALYRYQLQSQVYCWGSNENGKLGINDGSIVDSTSAKLVKDSSGNVVSGLFLDVKHNHSCISTGTTTTQGAIRCWGYNGQGRLGNGTETSQIAPTPAQKDATSGGGDVQSNRFSVGEKHSCALDSSLTTFCWGSSYYYQLATGSNGESSYAIPAPLIQSSPSYISAGFDHTCWVYEGRIYCVGDNPDGRLGNNTTNHARQTPAMVILP